MSGQCWRAGAATRTLTVPEGAPMDGYGARKGGVAGELSPLEVNVLYLSAGGGGALLVSLDLLAVDRAWVTFLRRMLQAQLGLRPELVMVAASHTHAGPAGFRRAGAQLRADASLRRTLRRSVLALTLAAAAEAVRNATDATLAISAGAAAGVAANRRNPDGPFDPTLTALTVRACTGEMLAAMWHFACHPTVLNADNNCLSPDLPGAVRSWLRERMGYGMPVLFLNGAAADVSTRYTRQGSGTGELARFGALLAQQFPRGGGTLAPAPPVGRLASVRLPAAPRPDPAEAARRVAEAEASLAAATASGAPAPAVRLKEVELMGARKRLARATRSGPAAWQATVQVLRLGRLTLAAFPGELYARQGRTVAKTGAATLAVGYAGDYLGYLPPADDQAGYEADSALVAPGAGDRLTDLALTLLKEAQSS